VTDYIEERAILGHGPSLGLCVPVWAKCASLGKARGTGCASRRLGVMGVNSISNKREQSKNKKKAAKTSAPFYYSTLGQFFDRGWYLRQHTSTVTHGSAPLSLYSLNSPALVMSTRWVATSFAACFTHFIESMPAVLQVLEDAWNADSLPHVKLAIEIFTRYTEDLWSAWST